MPGNTTSLYSSTGSSAIVSGTNTSGLYGGTGSFVVGTTAYGNVNVAAFLQSYTGNLQAGNATILGNLAAGGVLTDNYYYANGAPISFAGTYSNANVANFLPVYSGNLAAGNAVITGALTAATVSASGNITGSYILGNGSQLTGLPQSYGNANVSAFLPTYTGNLQAGNLQVINNGNISNDLYVGGTIYGTFAGNISGNLVVPGVNTDVIFNNAGNAGASSDFQFNDATNVLTLNGTANVNALNATGNITGSYFIGNGSQLTGLPASYSNANVATFLANFGSNVISTTGNITAGNIIGNGQFLTNLPGANVTGTVANATYALNANAATFAGTVTTNAQPNITSVGNLTSLTVTGDAVIGGNLEVDGNVTYIASNVVTINDKFINVANNAATASQADGGGIGVGPIGAEYATWTFDNGNTTWDSNLGVAAPSFSATGNVTCQYIIGDGSLLTNINASNITGAYGNANVANYLPTFTGNLAGNNLNLTGNIQADYANVIITYPYQFEIQGIGNATQVTTILGSGININPDAANFGINMFCDTANAPIDIGQSTANATGAINIGGFGGATPNINIGGFNGFTANVNVVSANLSTGNILATGAVSATGNITGSYILGNGSQLTGLPATYGNANVATFMANFGSNTISTTGNITGNYFIGNGSQLTGISSSYGNANVSNFLANGFGSNTITTTGNVSFGNINVTGTITSNTGAVQIPDDVQLGGGPVTISGSLGTFTTAANSSGYAANIFNSDAAGSGLKIQAGATSSQVLLDLVNIYGVSVANIIPGTGLQVASPGIVKVGAVTYTNTDGTVGQVLTTHGNGQTYFSTVSGGNATPAGSNTYVQFNDGGAFGGDADFTYDKTTNQLSVTGNANVGNLNATTSIVVSGSAGNISGANYISGNFFVGDGSLLTNVSGNSNSFSTIAANGTNIVAASSTDTLTLTAGTNITITGNAATDTITIAATGGGTPGGSDTQVQYNDGGAFGGMTTVTFTDSGANTGDLAIGNIIFASNNTSTNANIQTFNNWIKNQNDHIGNSSTANTYIPGRYLIGKGLGGTAGSGGVPGSFGVNMDVNNNMRNARMVIADRFTLTDTGVRSVVINAENWVDVSGNVGTSNTATRITGISQVLGVGGNGAGNLVNSDIATVRNHIASVVVGTNGNLNVGNISVGGITQYGTFINLRPGSSIGNAVGFFWNPNNNTGVTANFGNAFGLLLGMAGGNAAIQNYSGVYLGNSTVAPTGGGVTTSHTPTNYRFLNNQDLRSKSALGPLESYFDRPYTFVTTTGSTNLDWSNGTSQYLKPTGNVTLAFTGAITSTNGNLFHTVTLVVEQGTTPYTITLPTANATIKYAGGVSTPGATANAVIMITSTAANINGSTTYLTTVSPEFS